MSFKHSYSDVEKSTGLEPHYVRRLMRSVSDLRDRHTAKGANGLMLFDDSAIIVFQHVAQMRSRKCSFKEVVDYLNSELTAHTKERSPPVQSENSAMNESLLKALQNSHTQTMTAQQKLIEQMEQRIKLLTEAYDPEKAQKERDQDQARLMQLERDKAEAEQRTRDLMLSATAKQDALEQEQARLKAELESKQAESQAQEQKAREKATKRAVLLDQLDQLSWFQWGRKRELLSQIRELD